MNINICMYISLKERFMFKQITKNKVIKKKDIKKKDNIILWPQSDIEMLLLI